MSKHTIAWLLVAWATLAVLLVILTLILTPSKLIVILLCIHSFFATRTAARYLDANC